IGAARVGYINGEYVLNPTQTQLKESDLELVVAGTETAVLMVESEAKELPEDVMLGSVVFGHEQMQAVITAINELVEVAGKPEWNWQAPPADEALIARIRDIAYADLNEAFNLTAKGQRSERLKEINAKVQSAVAEMGEDAPSSNVVKDILH